MTRSKVQARHSAQVITPTRTRGRGASVALAILAVLALMLCSAGAATYVTLSAMPALDAAMVREAEAQAFSAGRVTAMAELSQAMADVYEQGKAEGQAALVAQSARGAAVARMGEVRP